MKLLLILFNCVLSFSAKNRSYIPYGLSENEWKNIKNKEKKYKSKNLGKSGISKGFRSRSLTEFMIMRENGEAEYNFPVFFAKERIGKGELKEEDIPYMQRKGGKPDGSDLNILSKFKKLFKQLNNKLR